MAKCVISGLAPGGDTSGFAKIQTGSFSNSTIVLESIPKILITFIGSYDFYLCVVFLPAKMGLRFDGSKSYAGSFKPTSIEVNGNTITSTSSNFLTEGNYIAIG